MKQSVFALMVIVACAACEKESNNDSPKDPVPVESVQRVSDMSGDFGWKLFQTVAKNASEENVILSPLSVQTALAMAVNGAAANTRDEMLNILGCANCDVNDLNRQTADLRTLMEEQSGAARLISANAFFYDDQRIDVLDAFVQTLTNSYKAGFQAYDFGDDATVGKINNWVKDHTDGKIDGIIDGISPLDLAFLINALHFKADWATGFSEELTHTAPFTTSAHNTVQVDYVSGDRNFSTAERADFRLVDIPFKDSTYSLSFVMPVGSIAEDGGWITALESSELKSMWSGMSYGRAIVTFPKLDLSFDIGLIDALEEMGMHDAFSETNADFSNLGHALIGPVIYISKVRHKAVLKVDEHGAEGAAVTSVGFSTTSLPPTFTFDKPFAIVLRHTATNAVLFAGLVNDPIK